MHLSYPRIGLALLVLLALIVSACGTITGSATIDELETQSAQYQATISALGTPQLTIMALEQYATQNVVLQARLSQAENESLSARATLTVLEFGGAGAFRPTPQSPNITVQPTSPVVVQVPPQATPAPAATTDPATTLSTNSQTSFSQTVTATDRDSMDCPVGVTAIFAPTEDTIYVFTRINYLPSGSRISARWTANSQLFFDDVNCWTPNQDYRDICAYCSLTPDAGATFESGDWSVDLLLNDQLMAQARFQVSGEASSTDTAQADSQTSSWKGN